MKNKNFNNNLSSPYFIPTYLERFIHRSDAHIYWKNQKGIYLGVNDIFASANNKQRHDVIGSNFDSTFGEEHALKLLKNDQEIISKNQSKTFIESANINGAIDYYLSHKAPLRTQAGKIIGVFGLSFPMNEEKEIFMAVNEIAALVKIPETDHFKNLLNPPLLSRRQLDCVYYLVRGNTMKQIAEILELSPKTVEHYLEVVKDKLKCFTRSDLITRALQLPQIREKL